MSILFDHGGTLLKFGGDALLGLFPADADQTTSESALRAVQAASAMQASMGQFAAIELACETRGLHIKCGISSGSYFAAHIGTPQSMAYVTTGRTVNRADHVCQPLHIVFTFGQTFDENHTFVRHGEVDIVCKYLSVMEKIGLLGYYADPELSRINYLFFGAWHFSQR